jgi:hypothetical protein
MLIEPPILTDPETREHYDETWKLYPFEHPQAYWLRATDGESPSPAIICTRCSTGLAAAGKGEHEWAAFVAAHLKCVLGHGLDGRGKAKDPLFDPE